MVVRERSPEIPSEWHSRGPAPRASFRAVSLACTCLDEGCELS